MTYGSRLNVSSSEPGFDVLSFLLPDDRSFAGIWSRPDVAELVFSNSAIPGPARFGGGPIGSGAPVQLIYWGDFWKTSEGGAREQFLTDGMRRMIDSRYWSGLAQYGINPPSYRGAMIVTKPGAPTSFDEMDPVLDLIDDLISDDKVPDPDDERIAFIVFMPRGFTHAKGNLGAHSSDYDYDFPFDTDTYWAGWVGYFGPGLRPDWAQEPDDTFLAASHELVGILTYPENDGWTIGSSNEGKGAHIPDAAINVGGGDRAAQQYANVNGTRVNAYWSNAHKATIIPIDPGYAGQLVGTVEATRQYEHSTGTFRPEATNRLCARTPECCIEDRDYKWTVMGIDETASLSIKTERYRTPRATAWRVGNQRVADGGAGTLNVTVQATEYVGRKAVTVDRSVAIAYVQRDNTLTLSTSNVGLNFDVNVQCEVRDSSFSGSLTTETDVVARPNVTVGFVGQRMELDPMYAERWEACLKALTAELKQNFMPDRQRRPRRDDTPLTIDIGVLSELPAWTRATLYERSARAADLERIARAVLPPEAAEELTAALLADSPELGTALEAIAKGARRRQQSTGGQPKSVN